MEAFTRHAPGHPVLSISYDDPSLADQLAHWITSLEQRLSNGETFPPDIIVLLDGWPFATRAVTRSADLVELHALDVTAPSDAPARYTRTADALATLACAQREAAASYGVLESLAPPHYLMTVTCCPGWARAGESVLARTRPMANESGWVLNCGSRHGTHEREHASTDEWMPVPVYELVKRRPALVRFFAFPVGSGIEIDLYGKTTVSLLRAGQSLDGFRNVAFTIAGPSWVHELYEIVEPRTGSTELHRASNTGVVRLDLDRDGALLETSDFMVAALLCERYGIGAPAAKQTLDYYHSRSGRLERWRWKFREVSAQVREIVEPILDDPTEERWRLHQTTARTLRERLGGPFITYKNLVEQMDSTWQTFAYHAKYR